MTGLAMEQGVTLHYTLNVWTENSNVMSVKKSYCNFETILFCPLDYFVSGLYWKINIEIAASLCREIVILLYKSTKRVSEKIYGEYIHDLCIFNTKLSLLQCNWWFASKDIKLALLNKEYLNNEMICHCKLHMKLHLYKFIY